jgi:hypothetical protein
MSKGPGKFRVIGMTQAILNRRDGDQGVSLSWCTPEYVLHAVRDCLGIIYLDPCSNSKSLVKAKLEYHLPEIDGLLATWNLPTIFVNPPFGAGIERWVRRCRNAYQTFGSEVLLILPSTTETRWWQRIIFKSAIGICFFKKRVEFIPYGGEDLPGSGGMTGCAMVYWGKDYMRFLYAFEELGAVIDLQTGMHSSHWRT